ncbi:ATP-binding cassette domain-containing protein [Cryptosporangium sp. NPDC048952]|uniref:ATP-binding cassette domain-containing protein n=1 Tax=Cryptosporangium sp. NPDC048952 TaxID=3363961 RepID=UPI00371B7DBB
MSALMEVTGLRKVFRLGPVWARRDLVAVRDVSFTIDAGQTYGLVGESGSGKSTVARLIARLEKPSAGTIRLDGQDIAELRGAALKSLRRDVQMVFQDPFTALNPRMSVRELVYEPWQIHGLYNATQRNTRLRTLLDQVGLPATAAGKKPVEFSGGQRQRIMIARALALEPKLLIADEPVSALDVSVQAQVLNVFKDLQENLGLACLFISHDLSVVEFVSDRVGVMYRGDLLEEGTPSEIYRSPSTDYTKRLLAAIPQVEAGPR